MSAFKGTVMKPVEGRNPYRFGEIPEFPVGTRWPGRRELCDDGVHAHLSGGIHGRGEEGAFSVVLSGGYEDDVDTGEEFTYTGQGGQARREDGAKWDNKQVRDQEWKLGNLALQTSWRLRKPVRVIRGSGLKSTFAPVEGYRYDGLYSVEEAKMKPGKSNLLVCLFRFKRLPNQKPLPHKTSELPMRPKQGTEPSAKPKSTSGSSVASTSTLASVASSSKQPSKPKAPRVQTRYPLAYYPAPEKRKRSISPPSAYAHKISKMCPSESSSSSSSAMSVARNTSKSSQAAEMSRLEARREEKRRRASLSNKLGSGYKIPKAQSRPDTSAVAYAMDTARLAVSAQRARSLSTSTHGEALPLASAGPSSLSRGTSTFSNGDDFTAADAEDIRHEAEEPTCLAGDDEEEEDMDSHDERADLGVTNSHAEVEEGHIKEEPKLGEVVPFGGYSSSEEEEEEEGEIYE